MSVKRYSVRAATDTRPVRKASKNGRKTITSEWYSPSVEVDTIRAKDVRVGDVLIPWQSYDGRDRVIAIKQGKPYGKSRKLLGGAFVVMRGEVGKDYAYEMTVGQRPMDEFKIDLVASGRPVPKRRAAKNGRLVSKPRKTTKKVAAEKIPSVWAEKGREKAVSDWQHGARGTIHTADLPSSLRSTEAWMFKGLTAAERSKAVRGMAAGYAEAWRYMGGKVVGKMVARKGR